MSIQSKPDYKIFAQDAKSGEIETFPDILRGWGVTIDRTGEIPPMEWFNAIGKRTDEWLLYLTQRGVPEWDASLDYPKSAVVTHSDVIYISLKSTKGESPSTTQAAWSTLSAFLGLGNYYTKVESDAKYQPKGDYALKGEAYPVGSPIPWPQSTPPSGFLVCNGQSFNKTTYPLLGSAYPSGFLPDLRGEFIRGLDDGRNVDSSRTVLSAQGDAIRNITGQFANNGLSTYDDAQSEGVGAFTKIKSRIRSNREVDTAGCLYSFDASKVVPTANENRPRNIAFLYIVRAA